MVNDEDALKFAVVAAARRALWELLDSVPNLVTISLLQAKFAMTKPDDDIIRSLDGAKIELCIELDLSRAIDVAIKNFLLLHHAGVNSGAISYEEIWDWVNYSQEIHQEALFTMQALFDLSRAQNDAQNTDKK